MPSAKDELRLYTLGSMNGDFDHVAAWTTTGQANGEKPLPLPATLKPGWYELRLVIPNPNPQQSTFIVPIARSEPIRLF